MLICRTVQAVLEDLFHPLIVEWFRGRFGQPTEPQRDGWPEIVARRDTLIAAPTGSGKTLAAFLVCIDRLLRQAVDGELPDGTQVVYVSPLKALSNDIERNLQQPLAEISALAEEHGIALPQIRTAVRTGDTPASKRQSMVRRPPHILVTTPESLYLLLGGKKSREILRGAHTVIVDEIHALARDRRGTHLALTLERLDVLCGSRAVRIGLSATQRPLDRIARFLVGHANANGTSSPACRIIDAGHLRELDLGVEVPRSELSAVCSNEQWEEVYARITELIASHRSTLVFVNTRRLAERVTHRLSELLGEEAVASHHGSLSRELRFLAEQRLKSGQLKAIVATASLELGIDVGYIDLVCQIGSPRSIATFLQRVGRSGHSLGAVPCGRLFPLTRDDLMEALALLRATRAERLDAIELPRMPLDVLAQQIVATVAADEWDEEELLALCRRSDPYHELSRETFEEVLELTSVGVDGRRQRGSYVHRDRIHGKLRARRGAALVAASSGGTIPDTADYQVYTADPRTFVGTVNEDFAIESMAGDIFLLGNTSWRILQVRSGEVLVQDAQGAPATIPFWLGEGPGRTHELSCEVSQLREDLAQRINGKPVSGTQARDWVEHVTAWLRGETGVEEYPARQAVEYTAAQWAALGMLPTRQQIIFERFFDESGGMQLVIHAPLGARVNRAWGLALRKRFCRSFNFELQASADDNGIVLSLGPHQSFALDSIFGMLNTENAAALLKQALLAAPMFQIRWRWNATRALALPRMQNGNKVPPPLQRFRSDDLLTAVFPESTACLEHIVGDIEIPDHPLVRQTVEDCLHEAMDLDRWLDVLRDVKAGEIELVGRDTREPSPFCYEILNANPYAFLDDAPLEERRARAVATRRTLVADDVRDLAKLDPEAIAQVREEAWPEVRDAEELHDVLQTLVAVPVRDADSWQTWFDELAAQSRAAQIEPRPGLSFWLAAERWPLVRAIYPEAVPSPPLNLPPHLEAQPNAREAQLALVRGFAEFRGPVKTSECAAALGLTPAEVDAAFAALESEGAVLRGHFDTGADNGPSSSAPDSQVIDTQWCQRRLLARIHRLTLAGARRRVRPVEPAVFLNFLLAYHGMLPGKQLAGRAGVRDVIARLQGFELPAGAWESEILAPRLERYEAEWLDELTLYGEVTWGRLRPPRPEDRISRKALLNSSVPLSLVLRDDLPWIVPDEETRTPQGLDATAQAVYDTLSQHGACFFHDLARLTKLLPAQVEDALGTLVALGLATADGFGSIRPRVSPDRSRRKDALRRLQRRRGKPARRQWHGGRWSQWPGDLPAVDRRQRAERWVGQLLLRYGVVFRDLLTREPLAPRWGELVPLLRRLEARGEVHGGRFVDGTSGEQYGTPAAVELLRRCRDEPPAGKWHVISASDPVNLIGIITPERRIAAKRGNTLALRDGKLLAARVAGAVQVFGEVAPDEEQALWRALRVTGLVRASDRQASEAPPVAKAI